MPLDTSEPKPAPVDTVVSARPDCESAKDDSHWWTAYARYSSVDGTAVAAGTRASVREAVAPATETGLTTWWEALSSEPTLLAVVDDPRDAARQCLVSGQATRLRQEMMIERLGAPSRNARAQRSFFRRERVDGGVWERWRRL